MQAVFDLYDVLEFTECIHFSFISQNDCFVGVMLMSILYREKLRLRNKDYLSREINPHSYSHLNLDKGTKNIH
jgi:hypothetical protein